MRALMLLVRAFRLQGSNPVRRSLFIVNVHRSSFICDAVMRPLPVKYLYTQFTRAGSGVLASLLWHAQKTSGAAWPLNE